MAKSFIVTLIELDLEQFQGASSKVVEGEDVESIARARLDEAITNLKQYWEKSEEEAGTNVPWEEGLYHELETEESKAYMLNGLHSMFNVFVFTLDGKCIDLHIPLPE